MRWLLLTAAFIELLSSPAHAHGEQVGHVLFSDAVVVVGWAIFLFIYKAPTLHKVGIFVVILLVILLGLLLIESWYLRAIGHPVAVSGAFFIFHMMIGILMIFLLRRLD